MRRIRRVLVLTGLAMLLVAASVSASTLGYWRFEDSDQSSVNSGNLAVAQLPGDGMTYAADTTGTVTADGVEVVNGKSYDVSTNTAPLGLEISPWSVMNTALSTGDFTIEAFIKIDAGATFYYDQIFNTSTGAGNGYALCLFEKGTQLRFFAYTASGGVLDVKSDFYLTKGEWIHVAAVGTYADNGEAADSVTVKLYVNGVENTSGTGTGINGAALSVPSSNYRIGESMAASTTTFHGQIDELRISDAALTPDQFLQRGDTLAYWRFENSPLSSVNSNNFPVATLPGDGMTYASDVVGTPLDAAGVPQENTRSYDVSTNTAPVGLEISPWSVMNEALCTGDFTIESFVKIDTDATLFYDAIFDSMANGTTAGIGLRLFERNTQFRFVAYGANNALLDLRTYYLPKGEWVHLAAVGTYADNDTAPDTVTVQLYTNYVAVATAAAVGTATGIDGRALKLPTGNYKIGESLSTTSTPFHGLIDEVRITQRALTPSEFLVKMPKGSVIILR